MKRSSVAPAILVYLVLCYGAISAPGQQPHSPPPDFRELLQQMTKFSPDPCGPPYGQEEDWHSGDTEFRLFSAAANIVTERLNQSSVSPTLPKDAATEGLKKLEQMSAKINAAWPDETRFHFQILDLAPALVVKMSIRKHETFFVFGVPKEKKSGRSNHAWHEVGSEERSYDHETPWISLDLYSLHRGPSEHARFLAKFIYGGCAGGFGVAYDAREWDPDGVDVEQIVKQEGALGLDDKVKGFEWIGELRTKGSLLTLPYCWFSAIDTWDNPSLCAVDTYDLSGDEVRFRSHTYNRPDLVPIAKAIEYAEKRDYPAVLGYCGSPEVASRMVADFPPYLFADDLRVTSTGSGKERVEMGYDPTYRFDVEKQGDHWLLTAFTTE